MFAKIDISSNPPKLLARLSSLPEAYAHLPLQDLQNMAWAGMPGIGYWPEEIAVAATTSNEVLLGAVEGTPVLDHERGVAVLTLRKRTLTADDFNDMRSGFRDAVTAKRNELIAGGYEFQGTRFQTRDESDRANIQAMGQAAMLALMAGSQPGDLRWAFPDKDFAFIAEDNSVVPMDAATMRSFYLRGASLKDDLTKHARALKDQIDTAEDPRTIDIETGWPE